jgi:hypothetical protein
MSSLSLDMSSGIGKAEGRLLMSLRYIKYFCCWMLVWQDSSVDGSILQFYTYIGRTEPVRPIELVLFATLFVFLIERTILADWSFKRSYFTAPIVLILGALFLSWARGVFVSQHYGVVFEVHESFELPFVFFLILNLMRDVEDRRKLLYIMVLGTAVKAFEGAYIKYFSDDPHVGWGVLQMWRDGFLLAFGIASTLLLLHYKGKDLRWLKKTMLWVSPVMVFTLIVSYRRTFFVAILASTFVMFVTVGKGRRLKQLGLLLGLLVAFGLFILLTDPIGFLARLAGIVQPGEEGSAYIRLMELPNVLLNIYHNPIFGTPIGTLWHEYYRMPTFANFTRVGVHNTYLYWPLRTGIFGTAGFVWMLFRMWKSTLVNLRLAKTEEDFFVSQLSIHILVIYQVACFFGLMYGDAVTVLVAIVLTAFQLQMRHLTGLTSYKDVDFFATWKAREIVLKRIPKVLPASS